ncbi:MAG: glycosyltransferase family 2 protein [Candidatus Syntropharchaeales archaeon]
MAPGPSDDEPLICVQIINFNGSRETLECIESINNNTNREIKIVVVDNGSTSSEVELLRSGITPDVKLIESPVNQGFSRANNLAWEYTRKKLCPEFLLLINNDTRVTSDFLEPMIEILQKNQDVGAVSPKIMLIESNKIDSAGSRFTNVGSAYSVGHGETDEGQYDGDHRVPMITACCMLIRAAALNGTYLFDRNFFMYLEELDLVLRLHNRKYSFMYTSRSIVYHRFSHSIKGKIDDKVLFKQCYEEGNRVRILLKHFPLAFMMRYLPLTMISFVYWQLRFLMVGGKRWWVSLNRGILEGIRDGLISRFVESEHRIASWLPWVEHWSITDMMSRGKRMEGRYGWK